MKEANKAGCRAVRKRQNRVEVYLNDEELKLLDELSGFCHHDRSKTIRQLIRLKVPVQAPPMEVTELTRQLRAVGNNLNQLAAKAHALDYRCGKFGFSVFLGNFNVCGVELPIPVRFERPEHIPDDLFLPVHQFKRFSCPCAFRMTERLDEGYGIVGGWLIVVRTFCHKRRRFIFFQLSHGNRLLSAGIKIRPVAVFPV